jgi:hypothetical protein
MAKSNNDGSGDAEGSSKVPVTSDDPTAQVGNEGTEYDGNGRELKEILIKIEFTGKHTSGALKTVYKAHAKLLLMLMTNGLIEYAIDNKNERVTKNFNETRFTSPIEYQSKFTILTKEGNPNSDPTHSVFHRIKTAFTTRTIKNNDEIRTFLRTNKIWMKNHQWCENERNVINVGLIMGICPKKYSTEVATMKVMQRFKEKDMNKEAVPRFKLIMANPRSGQIGTMCYSVEVLKEDGPKMTKYLTQAYKPSSPRETPGFLMMSMKRTQTKLFQVATSTTLSSTTSPQRSAFGT